jgi:glutathione S-transferase
MRPTSKEDDVDRPTGPIFHAALPDDWAAARAAGEYRISTRGRTLAEEGFVHCADRHQLEAVANRFYADVPELVVLTIDTSALGAAVVREPPADGIDELFPHVYGPIPVTAVVATASWRRGASGRWVLP